jgi:arylsulfatase A-like enzyme
MNTTHMHAFTHTKPGSVGQAGRWQSPYHDTMIDHDKNVGELLDLLDQLGISDNTIVIFASDNGPEFVRPYDGWAGPWRGQYFTAWEGGIVLKMVAEFEESVKQHPLIPMGTPDPYRPPGGPK